MILDLELKRNNDGIVSSPSEYKPSEIVQETTKMVMEHFTVGNAIKTKPYREFNDMSLTERQSIDQKEFNAWQELECEDPDEEWKCLSSDTEILTEEGWKGMGQISKGDNVLSCDLSDEKISLDTVKEYFEYDYNDKLINIKTQYLDELVTPNHRMIVKKYNRERIGNGKKLNKYEKEWNYVEAKDLGNYNYKTLTSAFYNGTFSVGEDIAELIGWILSDGWYDKKAICISQSSVNIKKVDRIRRLLDIIDVKYYEHIYDKKYKDRNFQEYVFRLATNDDVTKFIRELLPNKKPINKLLHLPLKEKERLLDGLCLGDGVTANGYLRIKDGQYTIFTQKDKKTLEWFQTLLHLMGKTGTIGDNYVSIHYANNSGIRKQVKKEIDYIGKVWSISTKRTNYIARRNGKIFITGNSNAIRPTVRNKVISIAAHVTSSLIFPRVFAQNDNDEEDRDASEVMRDLMEWRADQAGYEKTFLFSVIGALVNPATIIHTEFTEVMRKIKEKSENGEITEKEIVDEVFSGFQDNLVPVDELYIGDIYQNDIQKQPFLIRRRTIDYTTAQSKYDSYENFKYVKPGIQNIFEEGADGFYEEQDDDLESRQVEEVVYYNRSLDLQLIFINGVLVTDHNEPNPRQDKRYPFAKTGYELFDEGKFFYYKSLAFKLAPDAQIINTLYRMTIDGTYLELMPPSAIFGEEEVDSGIMMPGVVTSFTNKDSRMERLTPGSNLTAGMNALQMVEETTDDSSQSPRSAGQGMKGTTTAFEVAQLEKNAKTMIGLFGKMIGFLVKDLGDLFISDILQYITVGEVADLTSKSGVLKFRKLLLPEKNVDGQKITKRIEFDIDLPDEGMTEEQEMKKSFDIMKEEGGDIKNDKEIAKVNPTLFRSFKYKCMVSPESIIPPSDNIKKALNMEVYDKAVASPYGNQKNLYTDLLLGSYEKTRDNIDRYVQEPQPQQQVEKPKGGSSVKAVADAERMAI